MKRIILPLALALFVLVGGSVAYAESPRWTPRQAETIRLWYVYSDAQELDPADVVLGLRVLRRETQFGLTITGDCYNGYCYSIGPPQFHEYGVYRSTPQYREYGLAGRWNLEVSISAMAWAFRHGYQAHWRPWQHDARWWDAVPPDPRPALRANAPDVNVP